MTGRSPSLQLKMAMPGFKSVAAAVGAARAVRLGRSARSEAAVADFIGKRRAREIVVKVLERRLGDIGKSLVREKSLVRGDDHVGERHEKRERLVLPRNVRAVLIESKILILPCQS